MPRIIDVRKHPPPYVAATRFAPLLKPSGSAHIPIDNPLWIGRRDNVQMLRHHLWRGIKADDPEIVKPLLQIESDWVLGCWCCDIEGAEIYTKPDICFGQVILKACRYLRAKKGLSPLDD